MASQGYEEDLLQHWFPATEQQCEQKAFAEKDFREISTILERADKQSWSRIPRIYTVLRLIGQLDAIENFVQQSISDTWFPFTQRSLPEGLRGHSDRSNFLATQSLVCNTKALNLERVGARHGHFPDPSEIPLRKIGDLGKGGSGFVERVISTITFRQYALKRIRRGTTFRKDKKVLRDFENELSHLKRLTQGHMHIIELIGSFTDPKYVGILFPVADCNLAEVLEDPDIGNRRWSLRSYFGCLTSALGFLHDNKVRHKDIKPTNILIKDNEPYFTDFGVSIDWTEYGQSTTVGPTSMTPRYGAPEAAAFEPRNTSSDIWSLGCVFLEMWTALKGATMQQLSKYWTLEGQLMPYYSKEIDIAAWIDHVLALPGPKSDNLPPEWIKHMLQQQREDRWSAHLLVERIRDSSIDCAAQHIYIGRCCLDDEETDESVISYGDESIDDITVKPASALVQTAKPPEAESETLGTPHKDFPKKGSLVNLIDQLPERSRKTLDSITQATTVSSLTKDDIDITRSSEHDTSTVDPPTSVKARPYRSPTVEDVTSSHPVASTKMRRDSDEYLRPPHPVSKESSNSSRHTTTISLESKVEALVDKDARNTAKASISDGEMNEASNSLPVVVIKYGGDGRGETHIPFALVSPEALVSLGYQPLGYNFFGYNPIGNNPTEKGRFDFLPGAYRLFEPLDLKHIQDVITHTARLNALKGGTNVFVVPEYRHHFIPLLDKPVFNSGKYDNDELSLLPGQTAPLSPRNCTPEVESDSDSIPWEPSSDEDVTDDPAQTPRRTSPYENIWNGRGSYSFSSAFGSEEDEPEENISDGSESRSNYLWFPPSSTSMAPDAKVLCRSEVIKLGYRTKDVVDAPSGRSGYMICEPIDTDQLFELVRFSEIERRRQEQRKRVHEDPSFSSTARTSDASGTGHVTNTKRGRPKHTTYPQEVSIRRKPRGDWVDDIKARPKSPVFECLVCMNDEIPGHKIVKLQCGHRMCHSCLKRQFTLSVRDPQHMPPRCCTTDHIPLQFVERLFDDKFKILWNKKYQEYTTANRLYCPRKDCGLWIKPSRIRMDLTTGRKYARCGSCSTKICVLCKHKFHKNRECPKDEKTNRSVQEAKAKNWQKCYECNASVERKEGCNHITCRCRAQFCHVCAAPWKTCNCPWFSYDHLEPKDQRKTYVY